MEEKEFRKLTAYERSILERLLEKEFPGRDALRSQLTSLKASVYDAGDNYGSIEFKIANGKPAQVVQRVPVDGLAHDQDGMRIDVLLHVHDGWLDELEFLRVDGTPMMRRPSADDFKIRVRLE